MPDSAKPMTVEELIVQAKMHYQSANPNGRRHAVEGGWEDLHLNRIITEAYRAGQFDALEKIDARSYGHTIEVTTALRDELTKELP